MALTSLLVCDDTRTLEVLSRVLLDLEVSVEQCSDFDAALSRLTTEPFDAIVLDCKHEASAMELAVNARHSPSNQGTLIVALVDSENKVRELFAKGINFVLYKPVSLERAGASLRAAHELMRRERRRYQRIPLHASAFMDYAGTENVPATILDLSQDGIAIQCERRLPPRCKVYFQFTLPGHPSKVRLSGQAMWQDSTGRVGMRFVDVPQSSRRALGDWLQNHPVTHNDKYNEGGPGAPNISQTPALPPAGSGSVSQITAERRVRSRHDCRLSADVFVAGGPVPQRCCLSDISLGGCYVDTTEPLPVMTEIEIMVRTLNMKVRVSGVVREMHPAFGMGVSFTLTTQAERAQLQRLVDSQAAEQSVLS